VVSQCLYHQDRITWVRCNKKQRGSHERKRTNRRSKKPVRAAAKDSLNDLDSPDEFGYGANHRKTLGNTLLYRATSREEERKTQQSAVLGLKEMGRAQRARLGKATHLCGRTEQKKYRHRHGFAKASCD
jgi:hypothetical protein